MYIIMPRHLLRQRAFCGDSLWYTCSWSLIISTYHLILVIFRPFWNFILTIHDTFVDLGAKLVASNPFTPPWQLL